jgi:hypothetical protein
MSEILIVEKGQLGDASRKRILASDVVLVEVEDMSKVQFTRAGNVMDPDDMLWAALKALSKDESYSNKTQKMFLANLELVASRAFRKRHGLKEPDVTPTP